MSEALTGKGNHRDFKGEKEPDQILVMRVLERSTREDVQEFMRQTGAELVGAYRICAGIADPNSRRREEFDGMEFMFKMSSRDLGSPIEKTADIRFGFDMTDYFKEGFQSQTTQRQGNEGLQPPLLSP